MKLKLKHLSTTLWLGAAALVATLAPVLACNIELSAGLGLTQDKLDSGLLGGGKTDLNQTGGLLGLGAGCDRPAPQTGPVLGVMARYSLMRLVGEVGGGDTLKSDRLWEAAARLGWKWHDEFMPYAFVGWSGINLDLPAGLGDKDPNGPMAGLGMEARITGAWWVRGEYAWHHFNKQDVVGSDLQPDLHTVRLGVVLKFYEAATRAAPLK